VAAGTSLVYLGAADEPNDLLLQKSKLPEIIVMGRSNVGKSTLMNVITGRTVTTRSDFDFLLASSPPKPIHLTDIPNGVSLQCGSGHVQSLQEAWMHEGASLLPPQRKVPPGRLARIR